MPGPVSASDHSTRAVTGWLLASTVVMQLGIAALFPIVPLYVRHRGGGAVAAAMFVAGPMIANMAVQYPAGRLADRIGRRPLLIGARVLYAGLSFGLFADRGPLWLLAVLRAGQGVAGGAYLPALRATLTDITPPERRAHRFAQLQVATMVGLLIGPAVGGLLARWEDRLIFACSGAGAALSLLANLRIPETRTVSHRDAQRPPAGWWRSRGLAVACAGLAATGLVYTMYDVVWPQYLVARGFSTVVVGLSVTLFAAPILLLGPLGGRLADRADRRLILGVDLTVVGACAASYPFMRSLPLILGVGTVEAVATVMTEPALYATIADAAPPAARGRAMGAGGLAEFGGSAVGAAALGSLYGVGEGIPFWSAAGILVGAAALCAAAVPPGRRRSRLALELDAEAGGAAVAVAHHGDDAAGTDVD